jgi:hypothetical protein
MSKFCIAGVLYMFFALALVCDHYFVPTIYVLIERMQISEGRDSVQINFQTLDLTIFKMPGKETKNKIVYLSNDI